MRLKIPVMTWRGRQKQPRSRVAAVPLLSELGTFQKSKAILWPRVHVQIFESPSTCTLPARERPSGCFVRVRHPYLVLKRLSPSFAGDLHGRSRALPRQNGGRLRTPPRQVD